MLRSDLAAARDAYLREARNDVKEFKRRAESDFLLPTNKAGEYLDFHALRHTSGAWAILNGARIKQVQTLMRHSTTTLTLDTYGHMLPGMEAETVHVMAGVFGQSLPSARSAARVSKPQAG